MGSSSSSFALPSDARLLSNLPVSGPPAIDLTGTDFRPTLGRLLINVDTDSDIFICSFIDAGSLMTRRLVVRTAEYKWE